MSPAEAARWWWGLPPEATDEELQTAADAWNGFARRVLGPEVAEPRAQQKRPPKVRALQRRLLELHRALDAAEQRARPALDEELPPEPSALEASLGLDPWCPGCESRRVAGGGLCARCRADEVRR